MSTDRQALEAALSQARLALAEGSVPVGAAIVLDGSMIATGRNRRSEGRVIAGHAELDALERAGALGREDYARATVVTTLAPCPMCAGAIIRLGIRRVVVGDRRSVPGAGELLPTHGVEVVDMDSSACRDLIREFVAAGGELWP